MTLRIGADRLRTLIAQSDVVPRADLLTALAAHPSEVSATSTVGANELLPTYGVRLERWREEGIPPSMGLAEFVDALDALGQEQVVITKFQTEHTTFVLLLSVDPERLRACVAIERPGHEATESAQET